MSYQRLRLCTLCLVNKETGFQTLEALSLLLHSLVLLDLKCSKPVDHLPTANAPIIAGKNVSLQSGAVAGTSVVLA